MIKKKLAMLMVGVGMISSFGGIVSASGKPPKSNNKSTSQSTSQSTSKPTSKPKAQTSSQSSSFPPTSMATYIMPGYRPPATQSLAITMQQDIIRDWFNRK